MDLTIFSHCTYGMSMILHPNPPLVLPPPLSIFKHLPFSIACAKIYATKIQPRYIPWHILNGPSCTIQMNVLKLNVQDPFMVLFAFNVQNPIMCGEKSVVRSSWFISMIFIQQV